MFFKKDKKERTIKYDPGKKEPIIKASICNGEQVAGFRDLETGEFHEEMFIRNDEDLRFFKAQFGIDGEVRKVY